MKYWESWKYKNLTFFFISIILAVVLSRFEAFHSFLLSLDGLGYLGAFIAGALFVSTFTVSTGAVMLLVLAEELPLLPLGIIAGAGGVLGDLTIFRFVKDHLAQEVSLIYNHFGGKHLTHLLHTRYFHWNLPVIGAIIIASPFPDEIGVSLLGISKMKTRHFIFLSFVLNTTGIILTLLASFVIKP